MKLVLAVSISLSAASVSAVHYIEPGLPATSSSIGELLPPSGVTAEDEMMVDYAGCGDKDD